MPGGCKEDPYVRGMGTRRRPRKHRPTHRRPQAKGQDMTDVDTAARRPIALGATAGEAYSFFGTLVTIKAGSEETSGGAVITENLAPRGSGSPLHVHHREDEWFYVLEGELTFWVGGEIGVAGPGGVLDRAPGHPPTVLVHPRRGPLL